MYNALYKWAAQAVKDELLVTCREASDCSKERYNVSIHYSAISKAAKKIEVASPYRAGRKTFIPKHAEKSLWEFIVALRVMKVPVYKHTACTYANQMIEPADVLRVPG
ncbi:hypothetical protein CYMTET_8202 [Cymbomonas tetramitiformis]|uniref:Uncharacterized protein n=1 Tax=Cymbomonas tetramitiformis TaxID=36881 RepID=A0AAE0LGP9_9CHLO|nr:hypothetical protein CYMTET_8202 [Cymbomonas tetramitiformis]|eukprot:gene4184-5162_t